MVGAVEDSSYSAPVLSLALPLHPPIQSVTYAPPKLIVRNVLLRNVLPIPHLSFCIVLIFYYLTLVLCYFNHLDEKVQHKSNP